MPPRSKYCATSAATQFARGIYGEMARILPPSSLVCVWRGGYALPGGSTVELGRIRRTYMSHRRQPSRRPGAINCRKVKRDARPNDGSFRGQLPVQASPSISAYYRYVALYDLFTCLPRRQQLIPLRQTDTRKCGQMHDGP